MATITGISPVRGREGQVRVVVDGAPARVILASDVEALGLEPGGDADEALVARLETLTQKAQALQIARRFIAFRPRSVAEVRQRLRRSEFTGAVVESVVEALIAGGILDDRRFAEAWVENRTSFRPRSTRLLQQELRRRGIDRETAEQSLEGANEADELALAMQAGRPRLRKVAQLDRRAFDRAVGSFLTRRGFGSDATRAALDMLWSERTGLDQAL